MLSCTGRAGYGARLTCVIAAAIVTCSISCGSDDDNLNSIEKIWIRCTAETGGPAGSEYDSCLQRQGEALLRSQSISVELEVGSPGHELLNTCMIGATESGNVDWVKGLDCYLDGAESHYPKGTVREPVQYGSRSGFWDSDSSRANYVDMCTRSQVVQGLEQSRSRQNCDCFATELGKEFERHEYGEMLSAQPDPRGNDYDRRLFRIVSLCMAAD